MPYITQKERENCISPEKAGQLNYEISLLIHDYIKRKGLCYQTLNEVVGILECAKLELYRQVIAKYEDKKKLENGSVSELDSLTLEDVR